MSWGGMGSPFRRAQLRIMTACRVPDHRCHTDRVPAEDRRERLRQTFDRAAVLYDRVRPDYPEALFDDLITGAGLMPGGRLLEVGCATGKSTGPLARRGFRVTCVGLGGSLA